MTLNSSMKSIYRIVLAACLTIVLVVIPCGAETYYVDSWNGDDAKAGTNQSTAWKTLQHINKQRFQPGDEILLKSGSVFTGTLAPKGSGAEGKPIVLDQYGQGEKPRILGNTKEAVILRNLEYWTLRNLDVTNPMGRVGLLVDITRDYKESAVKKGKQQVIGGIKLQDLVVHNVKGKQADVKDRLMGGIIVKNQSEYPIRNLNISDCTIHDIEVVGLQSSCRQRIQRPVIRNLIIYDCGQDGLILRDANDGLIEHCEVYRTGLNKKRATAGLWLKNNDGTVIQYCEVYDNMDGPYWDGMSFDFDQNVDNCILQYCFSHDNEGGFFMICPCEGYTNTGNIVRYNISQNDGGHIFALKADFRDTRIYNNTIYYSKAAKHDLVDVFYGSNHKGRNLKFQNNIFYLEAEGHYPGVLPGADEWDGNCFYGKHPKDEPVDPHKITANPLLVAPGKAKNIRSLDGYKLRESSPCLCAGVKIPGKPMKDFWGNSIESKNAPNIGVYNGPGE